MSARWSRSLAMVTAWEPASPTESRSEGLWALAHCTSPWERDRRRSPSKDFTASEPEAHLLPHLVADHDPQVAGVGELAHPAPPGGQAGQGDADGLIPQRFQPGQAQRLDRGGPVHVIDGVVVEQPGQRPGDELAQGVAQQPGLVEEVPGGGVPALLDQLRGGGVEQVPQGGDGGLDQVGVAVGVPGEQSAGRP